MVRRLEDLCLRCIGRNLNRLSGQQLNHCMNFQQKETLLERMVSHRMLTASVLPAVTYYLFSTRLRKVNFYQCPQVTDDVLTQLGLASPNLVSISIEDCKAVTDVGLNGLLLPQRELVELELRAMSKAVTGTFFAHLRCPHSLRTVSLRESKCIHSDALKTMVTINSAIQHLSVECITMVDDDVVSAIAQTLGEHLMSLNISRACGIGSQSLRSLAEHCPNLQRLVVNTNNRLTGEGLSEVVSRCSITGLDLSCCFQLMSAHMHELYKLPERLSRLVHLHFSSHLPYRCLLSGVTLLTGLRELNVSGSSVTDDAVEEVCAALGNQLHDLKLSGCRELTDASCTSVARHCKKLVCLSMYILPNLTFSDLLPMFTDPKTAQLFQRLQFGGCGKLDASVISGMAASCHNLRVLDVAACVEVDDNVLHCLGDNCTQLAELDVKRCNKITDDGLLSVICGCPLRSLVASACRNLTDRSMIALAENCELLEEVYISGNTSITPAAVAYIEDMGHRRVTVKHKVPNAPADLLMAKNLDTGRYQRMS